MTRVRFAGVIVALLAGAALGAAQKQPVFSGTWIIQPPNKAAGTERVIKQDDKTISITTSGRTATYELDGVEHRRTMAMRGGEIVILTRAAVERGTVVIAITTSYPNNMKTVENEVWSIDAEGQLVIDFTEIATGQAPRVLKIVHRKKN